MIKYIHKEDAKQGSTLECNPSLFLMYKILFKIPPHKTGKFDNSNMFAIYIYILSITTEYTIADHIKTDHMGFHSDMNSLIF